jgi:hypothetical protein
MLKSKHLSCAFALVSLTCVGAWANDDASTGAREGQESGQAEMEKAGHSDGMRADETMARGERAREQAALPDEMKKQAKNEVAPHAIMVKSSLESAKEQISGLKDQMKLAKADNSDQMKVQGQVMEHFKLHTKNLKQDIDTAQKHSMELSSSVKKYPELANAEDYRSLNSALMDVRSSTQSWQAKAASPSYWKNSQQVSSDLDSLDQKINNAIDKDKSFSSTHLDFSLSG